MKSAQVTILVKRPGPSQGTPPPPPHIVTLTLSELGDPGRGVLGAGGAPLVVAGLPVRAEAALPLLVSRHR